MNLLDSDVVESCRDRNGRQKADRPSRIDNALSRPRLGHRNGQPIVEGYDYAEYPSRDNLSQPRWKDFLCNLFSHYHIASYDDAATEMTNAGEMQHRKWNDALEKAADLFNLDTDALFTKGNPPEEGRLEIILNETPSEHVIDPSTPTLVGHLYGIGLGVREINEILSDKVDHVTEEIVRDSLKRAGLIRGEVTKTVDRSKSMSYEEYDTRLGGPSVELDDSDEIKQKAKEADNITVR